MNFESPNQKEKSLPFGLLTLYTLEWLHIHKSPLTSMHKGTDLNQALNRSFYVIVGKNHRFESRKRLV